MIDQSIVDKALKLNITPHRLEICIKEKNLYELPAALNMKELKTLARHWGIPWSDKLRRTYQNAR